MNDTADLIVSLFAIGMGLAFVSADPKSPTSRALALCLSLMGATLLTNVFPEWVWQLPGHPLQRAVPLFEAGILATTVEWTLRIAHTATGKSPQLRRGDRLVRVSQAIAAFYGLTGFSLPLMRQRSFYLPHFPDAFFDPGFYLFAVPWFAAIAVAAIPISRLVRSEPDSPEWIRLKALIFASPFLSSALFVPVQWRPVTIAIGQVIFLAGAIRYHMLQGQRGQFLARFLSPQVSQLVGQHGLQSAMERQRTQLSVVACDLRGFTVSSEKAAPEEVVELLRDYYGAISEAVTEFGATIKDFAGDGVLCLLGAPVAMPDHASRALEMALKMRAQGLELLSRWKKLGLDLGIGIGVASGYVTVGVIGGEARLEYVAVGPAVNLASRLCDRARSGEVLVDQRTVGLLPDATAARLAKLEAVELKGFDYPVAVYSASSAAA